MANGNVLYLPPGVIPPVSSQAAPTGMPSGVPFDRAFFERILPQAIAAFCSQTECNIPRVELLTVDGTSHFITGIIAVTDSWVALQVAEEEHDHAIQVFIPYTTIYRVEVHPETERRKHIGFIRQDSPPIAAPTTLEVSAPAGEPEAVAIDEKKPARAPRKAAAKPAK